VASPAWSLDTCDTLSRLPRRRASLSRQNISKFHNLLSACKSATSKGSSESSYFLRSSHGVSLTDVGRSLLRHAHEILDAVARAQNAAKATAKGKIALKVGIITPGLTDRFAQNLRRLHLAHPEIKVRVSHPDSTSRAHSVWVDFAHA
jgi:hypothetical protein